MRRLPLAAALALFSAGAPALGQQEAPPAFGRAPGATESGLAASPAPAPPAAPRGAAFVAPAIVIYPRQVIRADMVEQRESAAGVAGGVALSFDDVIGKAARGTLLPGRPIPLAALGEPELVRHGAALTLAFREGGLDICAAGVALQAGGAGERIRARNAATGVVVTGTLRGDGVLLVESGL